MAHLTRAIRRPIYGCIVYDDQLAIQTQVHVQLDPFYAQPQHLYQSRFRVPGWVPEAPR